MSNDSTVTGDLISFDDDNVSFSSTFTTNPFIDWSWVSGEKSVVNASGDEGNGVTGGEGGAIAGASGDNKGDKTNFDDKLDKLINSLSRLTDRDDGVGSRDIRHIDNFTGEGSELTVVSKLKTYVADFDDFFAFRKLNDNDKLAYAKQKLSGPAKSLVNSYRPRTYKELRTLLYDSFGNINMCQEDLLSELKGLRMKERESFRQYSIRLLDLARVVAFKLECSVSDKVVFESLSKALLSKFEPYVNVQSQIKRAVKDRLPQTLVNELCDLIETDSRVFVGNEKKNNKVVSKNVNSMSVEVDVVQQLCGHCFRPGHRVSTCELLKNVNREREEDFFSRRPT